MREAIRDIDRLLHIKESIKHVMSFLQGKTYPNTMHRITLTYRHAAVLCPTLTGRTGETVVGGRSGAMSFPPIY